MFPHVPPSIIRISVPPAPEPPRRSQRRPHPPAAVAEARGLVEGSALSLKAIAVSLLGQARAEQHARSGKTPPPLPPPSTKPDAQRAEVRRAKRAAAAQKAWRGRCSKRNRQHAWMLERIDP